MKRKQSISKTGSWAIGMFLLCCYLCGCHNQNITDADKIVAACIQHTIGPGDIAKMAFRYFPSDSALHTTAPNQYFEVLKQKRHHDKAILDSFGAYLAVKDTFFELDPIDLADLSSVFKKVSAEGFDSSAYTIEKSYVHQKIDLAYLSKTIGVEIKDTLVKDHKDVRLTATFNFSTIFMNKEQSKAMVYQALGCGSKCGFGKVIFLNKNEGEWIVVHNENTWSN